MIDSISPETLDIAITLATKASTALAILIFGWIASKWCHSLVIKALRHSKAGEAVARVVATLAQYALFVFAMIASLDKAGIETASLAAAIAATGLAIGFALQGSLSNIASGVLLLLFRPFGIGDKVTTAGHKGMVEDIGLFATTLATAARERIIIPNGSITSTSIINHTASGRIRSTIQVRVAYGNDVDRICELLAETALSAKFVLEEPAPVVGFAEMTSHALSFVVHCWAEAGTAVPMQHFVRRAIYTKLKAEGIEIPFDQLVIHNAEPTPPGLET